MSFNRNIIYLEEHKPSRKRPADTMYVPATGITDRPPISAACASGTPAALRPSTSNASSNTNLVIVMPTPLPPQRNVSTSCTVIQRTKATSCVPATTDKETQTEAQKEKVILVPIPVPIYVPTPMHMFSMPSPTPVAFPIPIPVPIFIPTTRNSAERIFKDVKRIQNAIPSDPFEAELVKMAEVLAETREESDEEPEDVMELQEAARDIELALARNGFAAGDEDAVEDDVDTVETCILQTRNDAGASGAEKIGLQYMFGVSAWKKWAKKRNAQLRRKLSTEKPFKEEILDLPPNDLNIALLLFLQEVRKPDETEYAPDTIYYFCLGIQQYLFENDRPDNIFWDPPYTKFNSSFNKLTGRFLKMYENCDYIVTRVEEEHLWETKQLGVYSPQVLLNTIIYFNMKFFGLKTVDEHLKLSFSHVVKHWRKGGKGKKKEGPQVACLRFFQPGGKKEAVFELQESLEDPFRCPVKLYEFYVSKCPQSVKIRDDVYYLAPEKSCLADSPVWFSTSCLEREFLETVLNRYRMVKEISISFLAS